MVWGLCWVWCSASVWLWPGQAQAQFAVIDAANLAQNTFTTIQTIIIAANQFLELTPIDEIVLSAEFAADLGTIEAIIHEAQGLAYDVQSLQAQVNALFSLDGAPDSAAGLRERLYEIRKVILLSYTYALRTQTLLRTTLSTIRHVTRLISLIGALIGNMQANQTLTQLDGNLTQALITLQVQTAAYERAQSVERLAEPLTIESLHRINEAIMADWPK